MNTPKRWFRRLWKTTLVVLTLFLGAALILVATGSRDDLAKVDAALVLGNRVEPDGRPSERLKARLDRAAEVYREGWCRLLIVSGGTGKEGHDEAAVMRDYLIAGGIPGEAIVMDPLGVDTFASAQNTVRILDERGLHSVLVISQYFHLPRCRLALRRSGVGEIRQAPARFFEWRDIYSIFRELPALGKYWLRSDYAGNSVI